MLLVLKVLSCVQLPPFTDELTVVSELKASPQWAWSLSFNANETWSDASEFARILRAQLGFSAHEESIKVKKVKRGKTIRLEAIALRLEAIASNLAVAVTALCCMSQEAHGKQDSLSCGATIVAWFK